MFAVIAPKPSKPDRFIIKTDKKEINSESRNNNQKIELKQINTTKNIIENKISSNNFLNKPDGETRINLTENLKKDEIKRPKIRLSIIKDPPFSFRNIALDNKNCDKKQNKRLKELKIKHKKMNREGNFNCGRWTQEEHVRFIEAIMKYGNEWKQVQKHVGTRSSTQARSHAQKFFVKIKKSNALDLESMNLSKNSIKTLHELALNMNSDEYFNAIKVLNCVAFEKKNFKKRKNKRLGERESQMIDSSMIGDDPNSIIHLK
jgi:SHAQKYF class myb-like DNA-binding protein